MNSLMLPCYFPVQFLPFAGRFCSKMCNLESRSATFAGQRNRKFPVFFPVSRELPVTGLAANRGRHGSISQICEILLTIGTEAYNKGRIEVSAPAIWRGLTKDDAWSALPIKENLVYTNRIYIIGG